MRLACCSSSVDNSKACARCICWLMTMMTLSCHFLVICAADDVAAAEFHKVELTRLFVAVLALPLLLTDVMHSVANLVARLTGSKPCAAVPRPV